MVSFPTSLDNFSDPTSSDTLGSAQGITHSAHHANLNSAVEALEAKVGADSSMVVTSLDYLLRHIQASWLPSSQNATTFASVTASSLTSGRITTAGASGLLQDFAGLTVINTPSATAPSTGTNGPGLIAGIYSAGADGAGSGITLGSYGNGGAQTAGIYGYALQGTSASPGATISGDNATWQLRGHDGTNFVGQAAGITMSAGSTWTSSNHETSILFRVTANGSASSGVAMKVDSNSTLVCGGNFNSVGTFSAGTLRPHIQTASTATSNAAIAQTMWNAGAAGPTGILAKSRSGTPGTQGVITTGDTLGTMSWQGDDGTNFIEGARIKVTAQGTIGTGQVSGRFLFETLNASATIKTALTITEAQSVVVGNAALATNATDGFLYITSSAGAPTGTPTAFTGRLALHYDSTNNKLYVYNGAWKGVTLA